MFRRHVTKQITAYLHGELAPQERARFAGHVMKCRGCRARLQRAEQSMELLAQLPLVPATENLWEDIEAAWMRGAVPAPVSTPRRTSRPLGWVAAAAACLVCGLFGWWLWLGSQTGWRVIIDTADPSASAQDRLEIGQGFRTDAASRARIEVPGIGHVDIEPNTRVRLLESRPTERRLALDQGKMHASIWAPPRLFFVETPSALAIDYGCAYTLEVNAEGAGVLLVTSGWVGLVRDGRESIVPAGAMCQTQPVTGPGTPYFMDASSSFREALFQLDFRGGGRPQLDTILAESRRLDTLTLWHLLSRVPAEWRADIYDGMSTLGLPPHSVSREGILRLDQRMLERWKDQLESEWMRMDPFLGKKKKLFPR